MVKRLVKTLKHGAVVLFTTHEHAQYYDKQLPIILFGYLCGIYGITKISPHMFMIGQPPPLKVDFFLKHYYQSGVQFTSLNHYEILKVK
jgi:hypothetical protein